MNIKEWLPEFPVSSEDDVDLMNYFLSTNQINELLNTNKWMVLGRKGMGKTAIYKYLQSKTFLNSPEKLTIALNFKDYPWPIHKLYKEVMEGEINSYYKSWHYLITTQTLSKFTQHLEANGIKLSDDLLKAKKLMTNIYGNPVPSLIEIIKGKVFRIGKISFPSADFGDVSLTGGDLSFEELSRSDVMLSQLRTNAFTLHDYFQNVLNKSIQNYALYIVMDQLDENWLEGEISEYSKILINLINVCKSFNNDNIANGRKSKCILFLRTDIYDTLRFNDKNKVHQSSAIEIRWDEDSLNDMFSERIKKYKPADANIDTALKSNSVFELKYVKHGATPFKHILRMSFYRPRDIIVYFNKIRDGYTTSKTGLYTSKQLYAAERDYSLSLYRELLDEWANQKPEIEQYLNILQNIGRQKFSCDDFKHDFLTVYPAAQTSDINNSLEFLFQNSIIGQKISANWEYICTNPHMQINYSKEFHVNNGLKNRLVLAETRAKRATLPMFDKNEFSHND